MIPALNEILFMLSALFGLSTVFVAEETKLVLDLESKMGRIEHVDLKTPIQALQYAEDGLNKIDKATRFPDQLTQLKLDAINIEKKDDKLNAQLIFSFLDKGEILELLRFNLTPYGKSTASDSLYYHLLPSENLIHTNGIIKKTESGIVIRWRKNIESLELELMQKENVEDFLEEMKSITEYWKN